MKKELYLNGTSQLAPYLYPYNNGNSGLYTYGFFAIQTDEGKRDILICTLLVSYSTPGLSSSTLVYKGIYIPLLGNITSGDFGWTKYGGVPGSSSQFGTVEEHIKSVYAYNSINITDAVFVSRDNLDSWICEFLASW